MKNSEQLRADAADRAELDKIRGQIAAKLGAVKIAQRQPASAGEVRASLLAEIRAGVYACTPENAFESHCVPGAGLQIRSELRLADLAYLFGEDALVDMAIKRMQSTGKLGMDSQAQRADRLSKLQAELDQLETAEELESLRLEAAGHAIVRRREVRAEIIDKAWSEQQAQRVAA